MPVMELFDEQPAEYKEQVIPSNVKKRLAIEMGASMPWYKYVGSFGKVMGIDQFGASGKGPDVVKHFGFTPEKVAEFFKTL